LRRQSITGWVAIRTLPALAARLGSVLCQFLFMLELAHLLGKDDFASFMLAFGILRLVSGGLANGSCALLARRAAVTGPLASAQDRFYQFLLLFTLGIAIAVTLGAAATYQLAYRPIDLSKKLVWWLGLAPMFILGVGAPLEMARLDLRGDVNAATLWTDFGPNALRVLMVPALMASSLNSWQLCVVMGLTQVVPLCPEILAWRRRGLAPRPHGHFDLAFYVNYVVQYFLGVQVMGVDLLLLAFAIHAPDSAEYILAIRLLSLSSLTQTIIIRTFAFDLSDAVRNNNRDQLQSVIVDANTRSFSAATFSIGGLLLCGPTVLHLFGKQFTFSPALLCLLATVFILYGSIGISELLMRLKGMANVGLGVLTAANAILVISAVSLGQNYGAIALAFGLTASALFAVVAISVICYRRLGITLFDQRIALGLLTSLALIGFAARFPVGSAAWNAASVTLALLGSVDFILRPRERKNRVTQ
jgi:O-antigen/teichoic acid export membrane protein